MKRMFSAVWVILGLAWSQPAVADPSVKDLAARTELHPIETLSLSRRQFLTGDKNGKAVTIAGELRFPQGASGRLPAVILQHGSGGSNAAMSFGQKLSTKWGLRHSSSTASRSAGLTRISLNRALFGPLNAILDAYRAFDVIANHPRIDPARIALMGFSLGGGSALYSSLKRQ